MRGHIPFHPFKAGQRVTIKFWNGKIQTGIIIRKRGPSAWVEFNDPENPGSFCSRNSVVSVIQAEQEQAS